MPDPWPIIGWAVIILAMLLGIWAVINDIRERIDQWQSRRRMERYRRLQESERAARHEQYVDDFTKAHDRAPESEAELNLWVTGQTLIRMRQRVNRFFGRPDEW